MTCVETELSKSNAKLGKDRTFRVETDGKSDPFLEVKKSVDFGDPHPYRPRKVATMYRLMECEVRMAGKAIWMVQVGYSRMSGRNNIDVAIDGSERCINQCLIGRGYRRC